MKPLHVGAGNPAPLAQRALAAGLYEHRGLFRINLECLARGHAYGTVSTLEDDDGQMHGVCYIADAIKWIQIFVTPLARRKGWGYKLVQAALAASGCTAGELFAIPGEDFVQSTGFWKHCGIQCTSEHNGVPLSPREKSVLLETGRVLIDQVATDVDETIYENLYLTRLYSSQYTEEQDGLLGQLMCIFTEHHPPFDTVLYHYDVNDHFISLATVRRRVEFGGDGACERQSLQLFVAPKYRRQGLGQQIIDRVKELYPNQVLCGYHSHVARSLMRRNGIINLLQYDPDPPIGDTECPFSNASKNDSSLSDVSGT